MSYDKEREWLKSKYPYQSWRDKVDKMGDGQVIAIFKKKQAEEQKSKENK